jgi:hypothetical protein
MKNKTVTIYALWIRKTGQWKLEDSSWNKKQLENEASYMKEEEKYQILITEHLISIPEK